MSKQSFTLFLLLFLSCTSTKPSVDGYISQALSLSDKGKQQDRVKYSLEHSSTREECSWLDVNPTEFSGTYKSAPDRDHLDTDINENLIIELYSK